MSKNDLKTRYYHVPVHRVALAGQQHGNLQNRQLK